MRSHIRLATALLGLGLAAAACSDAQQVPADAAPSDAATGSTEEVTEGHGAHGAHGPADHDVAAVADGPVAASVLGTSTGAYGPLEEGLGSATNTLVVEGTVTLVKDESGTEIVTNVTGLLSGEDHAAHLHDGSCTDFGGHYMHDHSGPAAPPNEIWLSSTGDPEGSLQPSQAGTASGSGRADWVPREVPLSMMIHDSALPGLPIACADFAAYDGPVTLVLEPAEDGIESLEYAFDDGEWQPYDGPVEIAEAGSHTVSYAGTDADGVRTDPQQLTLTIAGSR